MPTTDATGLIIIKRSMKMAGLLQAGENPASEDSDDILEILNGMLDSWTMDRLFVYVTGIASHVLVSGTQSYTIGQSGSPSFNAVRPNKIENANLVFTSTTPNVRKPLQVLDHDQWMSIAVRNVDAGQPLALYYERSYPNGTLNFWPKPGSGYSVELEVWTQLAQFADLATSFSFPPGYYDAIYMSLAERLCTPEWGLSGDQSISDLAKAARMRIQSLNMDPPPILANDVTPGGGLFNAKNPTSSWYR